MEEVVSIEQYLEQVGRGRGSDFGRRFRSQFRDTRGSAELAMLAAPSEQEYEEFCKVVAAMTEAEKTRPEELADEQIQEIAGRCAVDSGNAGIFINGYILARKQS